MSSKLGTHVSQMVVVATAVAVMATILLTFFRIESTTPTTLTIINLIVLGAVVLLTTAIFMRQTPISYRVAIVGFPSSGKTTLIVSLFGEAFDRRISSFRMIPKGATTIDRINSGLARLQMGRALGPTQDQDLFAFRADVRITRFPLPVIYKVEFGDFAGSASQLFSQEDVMPLPHGSDFFKWIADSDAIVLVVDLGRYLMSLETRKQYVVKMTTALRATWQHFLDVNEDRRGRVRRHPLVLAFTKADLLEIVKDEDPASVQSKITKWGFGVEVPKVHEVDSQYLSKEGVSVMNDFSELIRYFEGESGRFKVVFTSSFALSNEKRLGLDELMAALLPK